MNRKFGNFWSIYYSFDVFKIHTKCYIALQYYPYIKASYFCIQPILSSRCRSPVL